MDLKSQFKVPIKCPGCGRTSQKSLKDLERSPTVTCTCGARIEVGGDLKKINRSMGDLEKSFKKLERLGR